MITIPDGVTPEDIMRGVDILPGQDWLTKTVVLQYANAMQDGIFPWAVYHERQEMAVEVGTNGKVLTQGHHRLAAARLAGIEIPYPLTIHTDLLSAGLAVPYGFLWSNVRWK